MKLPFRFHRGELNGFFLLNLVTFLNFAITDIVDELCYWAAVQFKTDDEPLLPGEVVMRDSDILGIGAIAGIFPIYMAFGSFGGMVHFSESTIVAGKNRSERGLYQPAVDAFTYVHTADDDYPDDITTLATPDQRTTLVPTDQPVLGYVRSDQNLYDTNGNVIWANVLSSPPVGVAYDPFYGEDFLTLSSDAQVDTILPIALSRKLIELMQTIRYNGPTLKAFFEATELLCGAFIYDVEITFNASHYIVTYAVDLVIPIEHKIAYQTMWEYIVETKFKLFELVQNS